MHGQQNMKIKIHLYGLGLGGMDWISLAQDRVRWGGGDARECGNEL